MPSNPTISRITLPTGTTYDIKDEKARADIASIINIQSGIAFLGITTTILADNSTVNPIVVNGENVNAQVGNLVFYGKKEFIFDGTYWREFGDLSSLGNLAAKDQASGSYTPTGSIGEIQFQGATSTLQGSFVPTGYIEMGLNNNEDKQINFTPSGTISTPDFTGNPIEINLSSSVTGSVGVTTAETGNFNYTPKGSVSKPSIEMTNAGSTVGIRSINYAGTMTTVSFTVASENLTFGYSQGQSPSISNTIYVKTGDASYALSTNPTFNGQPVAISASFSGDTLSASTTITPSGTVSTPSFTGEGVELKGRFNGTVSTFNITATPSGTITTPSFIGDTATITVS